MKGKIEVICGGMYSGKSKELIRRMTRFKYAKKNFLLFKIDLDNRYDENDVATHDGQTLKATPVSNIAEMDKYIKMSTSNIIGIDEITFFESDIVSYVNMLANNGYHVIVSGLDQDFLGRPFPIMAELLAIADDIEKIHAICVDCGDEASKSFRTSDKKEVVVIGSTGEYIPLCRDCYNKHRFN